MGLFDMFGDGAGTPDPWNTTVTPGSGDPNNLSLAEQMRLKLMGTTDKSPGLAEAGKAAGGLMKAFGQPTAAGGGKTMGGGAGASVPGQNIGPMIANMQKPIHGGTPASPFGVGSGGSLTGSPPGHEAAPMKKGMIYNSPFGAA